MAAILNSDLQYVHGVAMLGVAPLNCPTQKTWYYDLKSRCWLLHKLKYRYFRFRRPPSWIPTSVEVWQFFEWCHWIVRTRKHSIMIWNRVVSSSTSWSIGTTGLDDHHLEFRLLIIAKRSKWFVYILMHVYTIWPISGPSHTKSLLLYGGKLPGNVEKHRCRSEGKWIFGVVSMATPRGRFLLTHQYDTRMNDKRNRHLIPIVDINNVNCW